MRPITVSVGPLAGASANNIATSQSPAGTTGSAAATFTNSSASISATNSLVAGQKVTFTALGGSLPAGFTQASRYFVIATGLSGAAFQVSSTLGGTAITAGSAPVGSINVNYFNDVALNGTLFNSTTDAAVLDSPRRILITTADTTTTFTIRGTAANGTIQSESFLIVAGSSYSTLDYATVIYIRVNQAPTAAVTVGTNGIASTPWARMDEWANTQIAMQIDVSGTVNYTVQSTMDDPNSPTNSVLPSAVTWIATNDTNVVGATSSLQTNYLFSPVFIRVLLNSGSGSLTATMAQSNVASR